jgi:stage V sporulation protein B
MLMALALSVVFFALSTLNSQILQGLGKLNAPIVNAGIALALQTLIAVGLVLYTDLDLYGIVIATTLYALILCILNQRSVRKAIDYKQEVAKTFVIPFASAAMMGGLAWAVYEGLLLLTKSPSISVIPAIAVSVPFYFAMLLIFRGVNEQDLRNFPKGHLLVKGAKKLHLLK